MDERVDAMRRLNDIELSDCLRAVLHKRHPYRFCPVYQGLKGLIEKSQMVIVSRDITSYCKDLAREYKRSAFPDGVVDGTSVYGRFPDDMSLISDSMVLGIVEKIPDTDFDLKTYYLLFEVDGVIHIYILYRNGDIQPVAGMKSGGSILYEGPRVSNGKTYSESLMAAGPGETTSAITSLAFIIAFALRTISEKSFITHRKAARGEYKKARAAAQQQSIRYSTVSWNIGETIKREVEKSDPKNATALHFRRAHWRHAKEGQPKAVERDGYDGWWCWVKSCWAGHPAFGIVRHTYTPKLPT